MNPIFLDLKTSIFETMSLRARELGAVNLGQGFPESDGFEDVRRAAANALIHQSNQYPPMRGLMELRHAVAAFYGRTQNLTLDTTGNVLITSGATEAICAALLSLITPGDEVVVFEPMYDAYIPLIERAGGVPRVVQLKPPHWRFDDDDLKAAFSDRTKLVMITTPNNPTTHALTHDELESLGRFCARYNAVVISDEVWENVVFDQQHLSVLHIDSLKDRALKIGSAGKLFALTGWKVGFVCGASHLIDQVARAHQFITFTTPPNLQHGVAYGLGLPAANFDEARTELRIARDYMATRLGDAGFEILPADGSYFLNIDLTPLNLKIDGLAFAHHALETGGVATIPLQAFCPTGRELPILRLCFAKSLATLDKGIDGLIKAAQTAVFKPI
ncbi:aminotransferase [Asticcacaulis sp. ZE23SCel15]|uniref:aminotransferase n=1 Tax=Asticcacaulis sp. ZE23SCel15 TaxID=3059027 RepID=UPI00265FA85A|nr:aminotransferase [Asticcacaulis sp. ZE23SCel15]WKL58695.1 aminotransferase [Asticcacaulis sp. ZE23SCel15]